MPATETDRAAWKAAQAEITRIEEVRAELLKPTNEALWAAQEQQAQIEERTGALECICEACGEPVFAGEPWLGGETPLCGECAPTYAELLTSPELFVNMDEERMTPEQAKALYDAHIAAGGKPTDSMAKVQ